MHKKFGVLLVLVLLIFISACTSHNTTPAETLTESGTLTIKAGDEEIGTIAIDAIRELPDYKRTMMIHSTSGDTNHSFRGARLQDVLNAVDSGIIEKYTVVSAIGADNYLSEITMEEVKMENNVYIMYDDKEKPLLTKDGKPCGMRLVILQDEFGLRFTNYLTELLLE